MKNNWKKFNEEYDNISLITIKNKHAKNYYLNQKGRFQALFKLIQKYIQTHEKGLDIGVYPAYFTFCLKKIGYDIEAVDIYPERISKKIKNTLKVSQCDVETQKLPFPNDTFDYVVLTAVIEHLRINPLFTLRDINRILKPGGKLIIQTPNLCFWPRRISMLSGKGIGSIYLAYKKLENLGHIGHVRLYSMHELSEIVEKTGFKIKTKKWTNLLHKNPKRNIYKILQIIQNIINYGLGIYPPLRKQLFVVCTKCKNSKNENKSVKNG